jgi:hypothetical protein
LYSLLRAKKGQLKEDGRSGVGNGEYNTEGKERPRRKRK